MKRRKNVAGLILMAVCVTLLFFGSSPVLAENTLKVGVYGGYFKDSFDKHIFPDFTKDTGIKVESVAEPTGEAWLVQLEQAAKAGVAPADVSMMAQVAMLRGQRTELWMPLDLEQIPNYKFLLPQHVHKYADGRVDGIGAVSWYITLVSNTKAFETAPASWADMWQPDKKNKLGLLALASNSFLMEITAKTFFGGYDVLNSKEGVLKVLNKLAGGNPHGTILSRCGRSGGSRWPPGALHLPQGGRRIGFRLMGCVQGNQDEQGGPHFYQLHVPASDSGQTVAQSRHGADGETGCQRADGCGIFSRVK